MFVVAMSGFVCLLVVGGLAWAGIPHSPPHTHRHVGARPHKRVGHGVDELTAHAKITQLDLPARVHQDVGRLHIYTGGDRRRGGG